MHSLGYTLYDKEGKIRKMSLDYAPCIRGARKIGGEVWQDLGDNGLVLDMKCLYRNGNVTKYGRKYLEV